VREVADLAELVQVLDLGTIRFYELRAEWDDTDGSAQPERAADTADGKTKQFSAEFRTAYRQHDNGVDYRVDVTVPIPNGQIRVDAAAMYVADDRFSVSERVLFEFGDMVAVMTLLPYLRQAVMDLSIRVGTEQVVLPIIARGAVTFGDEGAEPEDSLAEQDEVAEPEVDAHG
jgi:hypothetical protein